MRLRSLLFVPGDRPERMDKALRSGADALILDLEDSVSLENKPVAREAVATFLRAAETDVALFVRVNPLVSAHIEADLKALGNTRIDGIMLPKAEGAASISDLAGRLAQAGLGDIRILPIATETPAAVFQLGSYTAVAGHLHGVTWGAEDLSAAVGAATAREANGRYTPPYELARSLTLFAAAAADVAPIETVYPDFRDMDGLVDYATRAARDGFTGMMAIHPSQVTVINTVFTPSEASLANAREIVAAFAAQPGAGVVQIDGRMIDAPHLKQAQRILARAAKA